MEAGLSRGRSRTCALETLLAETPGVLTRRLYLVWVVFNEMKHCRFNNNKVYSVRPKFGGMNSDGMKDGKKKILPS